MLDYNYRSLCCNAPLRLSRKIVKKREIKVWACTKCRKNDVAIIPKGDPQGQGNNTIISEDSWEE